MIHQLGMRFVLLLFAISIQLVVCHNIDEDGMPVFDASTTTIPEIDSSVCIQFVRM